MPRSLRLEKWGIPKSHLHSRSCANPRSGRGSPTFSCANERLRYSGSSIWVPNFGHPNVSSEVRIFEGSRKRRPTSSTSWCGTQNQWALEWVNRFPRLRWTNWSRPLRPPLPMSRQRRAFSAVSCVADCAIRDSDSVPRPVPSRPLVQRSPGRLQGDQRVAVQRELDRANHDMEKADAELAKVRRAIQVAEGDLERLRSDEARAVRRSREARERAATAKKSLRGRR